MRFFVTEDRICGELIALEPTDAQHVSRVLRMRPGEEITVCCGNGKAYLCALEQVGKSDVTARILSEEAYDNEPTAFVTVYAGLSKGDRFDYLIQKCVECGVSHIVPFETALQAAAQNDCGLFLYEKEQQKSLSTVLKAAQGSTFAVVTGPEGGFSEKEAQQAQDAGLACVSIGPRILRCETAPVAALCAIMYQTGNFDIGE